MNLRRWIAVCVLFSWPVLSEAAPAPRALAPLPAAVNSVPGASSQFNVTDETEVPGRTLKPGSYTIRIVDHLSDRMIVQVNRNGKTESTFLALPASKLARPASPGPITVTGSKSGRSAIRGFAFPNGTLAEFVYPKAEAVTLAKTNSITVPAIDPASEGMTTAKNLSPTDMQMVTLWMLSPTEVGPNDSGPGIAAARYQAPAPASSANQAQVASAKVPARPVRIRPAALRSTTALPHTAGDLPLVLLIGLVSAIGAGLLARRRLLQATA
jgi:hypothetical protein